MRNRYIRGALTAGLCFSMGFDDQPLEVAPQVEAAMEAGGAREDIVHRIGESTVRLAVIPPETLDEAYPASLVVQPESADMDCAVEYFFDEETLSVGIFGKTSDMADIDKINGEAMFNGTFGHGDSDAVGNSGLPTFIPLPENTPAVTQALAFIEQKTEEACQIFEAHVNDPNSGYPG